MGFQALDEGLMSVSCLQMGLWEVSDASMTEAKPSNLNLNSFKIYQKNDTTENKKKSIIRSDSITEVV